MIGKWHLYVEVNKFSLNKSYSNKNNLDKSKVISKMWISYVSHTHRKIHTAFKWITCFKFQKFIYP